MFKRINTFGIFLLLVIIFSCRKDPVITIHNNWIPIDSTDTLPPPIYDPTPFEFIKPAFFPPAILPANNPLTIKGVALGRKMFYDPILSKDSTQSCGSCHNQQYAFTDNGKTFSVGVDGILGFRNSMTIVNFAFNKQQKFFWDGRALGLMQQALEPVPNPIEMHLSWEEAIQRLKNHKVYRREFFEAFGTFDITSEHVAKSMEQFMLTLISYQSKMDEIWKYGSSITNLTHLTPLEIAGHNIYVSERGDCFHCHDYRKQTTDDLFHNNGLDAVFTDLGLGAITNNPMDYGKFRTPSLRNIELTAPYMHDGRFSTLEQVIQHYSEGIHYSATVDPLMFKGITPGQDTSEYKGKLFTPYEISALVAFLKTFTDTAFINNPNYANPFE